MHKSVALLLCLQLQAIHVYGFQTTPTARFGQCAAGHVCGRSGLHPRLQRGAFPRLQRSLLRMQEERPDLTAEEIQVILFTVLK